MVENYSDTEFQKLFGVSIQYAGEEKSFFEVNSLLKPGTNKILINKLDSRVIEKPYSVTNWPSTLGYPNFIIHSISTQ